MKSDLVLRTSQMYSDTVIQKAGKPQILIKETLDFFFFFFFWRNWGLLKFTLQCLDVFFFTLKLKHYMLNVYIDHMKPKDEGVNSVNILDISDQTSQK